MQRAARMVNVALLILIAYSAGSYAWTLWAKSKVPAATAPVIPAPAPAPQVDIAALHLFGESGATPASPWKAAHNAA